MRRPGPPREIPPRLELECLKALWSLGEGTVREVRQQLEENHNLAYTTVMTVLDRLEKRGGATRRKLGRSFLYAPKVSRDTLRRCAVKELIDSFFGGSEQALLDHLGMNRNRVTTSEPGPIDSVRDHAPPHEPRA